MRITTCILAGLLAAVGCSRSVPEADPKPVLVVTEPDVVEEVVVPTTAVMVVNGLRYKASVIDMDLYKIEIEPCQETSETETVTLLCEFSQLVVDPHTGTIRMHRAGGDLVWSGSVRPLDSFGRASVPGLEVRWGAPTGEVLFGLGERFNSANQYGRCAEMWIMDAPGQGDDGALSYYGTPVLYSSLGYAFFAADNPEGLFDMNSDGLGMHRYQRAGQKVTFYLAGSDSMKELIRKRMQVQGPLKGVPDWAWGPWISRNSYETQAEAEEAIQGMIDRDIPVSVIVQEAWKGSSEDGAFNQFSEDRWPDVEKYLAWCKELHIKNVLWQVPIIHPSSPHYAVGKKKGYFVKKPDGSISHREHWLAGFANIDFTNPDAVRFWQDLLRPVVRMGTFGFKADDGEDIKPDDVFADGRRGWEMHNEYSALYAAALTDLFEQEDVPGMLWSRSGSLGLEHSPALWAGDQFASWEQLRSLVPAGLSSSMSGMPFWSHDIGGYIGDPSPDLYMRWVQFGAFSPFMQYHGIAKREPWEFGQQAVNLYTKCAHLRMNLRPTLMALAQEAVDTGVPLMRPMYLEFPDDPRFADEDTQYMLGPDLLVAPVLEEGAMGREVKFPAGVWQHLLYPVSFEGPATIPVPVSLDSVPVFVQEGAVLKGELAEGASLGQWRKGMPVRDLSFTPDRVVFSRFSVPTTASVLSRKASMTFDVSDDFDGEIRALWRHEGVSNPQGVRVDREGSHCVVDLAKDLPADVLDKRQIFILQYHEKGGRTKTAFEGVVRWQTPIVLSVEQQGSHYVQAGYRDIKTRLRNRSADPVTVKVSARPGPGAKMSIGEQSVTVPPWSEKAQDWMVQFEPLATAADGVVEFVVTSGDEKLDLGQATYTRPIRWAVAGPFHTEPKEGYGTVLLPEWITDPDVSFRGGEGVVHWWALDRDHTVRNDGVNFIEAFGDMEHAVGYAMTKLQSSRAQDVNLCFGSDDTLTVWLNGEKLHSVETYRLAEPDQEVVRARLAKGVNTLVVKVAQDRNSWKLHFHLTQPDGAPVSGVVDGFSDYEKYAPSRPVSQRIEEPPVGPRWQVAGPYSIGPEPHWKPGRYDNLAVQTQWPPQALGVEWMELDALPLGGLVDLNAVFGQQKNVDCYVAAELTVKRPTPLEIRCGSDDGILIWVNGRKVLEVNEWRGYQAGENSATVMLEPGANRILCRIRQGKGAWQFNVEFWDVSEKPIRPFEGD